MYTPSLELPGLEASVRSLEGSLDTIEFWLAASTLVVVVGLIVEYWDEVLHLLEEIKLHRFPPFPWKRPAFPTKELRAIVGGVLVTLGVAGELALQWHAARIENRIRGESHQIEALLNERAANAEKEATEAAQKAESFRLAIATAEMRAAEANKKAESFRLEIAQANEKAAQASLDLAKYKAPRALTDDQGKAIAEVVKPFGPQEFQVVTYWDSREPMAIAQRLADVLVGFGGWKLDQPKSWVGLMGGVTGVQVWIHPEADEQTKRAADALVKALNSQGLEAVLKIQNPENNPKNNKIDLSVGSKQ